MVAKKKRNKAGGSSNRWPSPAGRSEQESDIVILDPETRLEQAVMIAGIVLSVVVLVASIVLYGDPLEDWDTSVWLVLFVPIALAWFLKLNLEERYEIGMVSKLVRFRRSFFGRGLRRQVCHFDEITCVAVRPMRKSSDSGVWWEYGLVLLLEDGRLLDVVSPDSRPYHEVQAQGKNLANQMGVPFEPGQPEKELIVSRGGKDHPPRVSYDINFQDRPVKPWVSLVAILVVGSPFWIIPGMIAFMALKKWLFGSP